MFQIKMGEKGYRHTLPFGTFILRWVLLGVFLTAPVLGLLYWNAAKPWSMIVVGIGSVWVNYLLIQFFNYHRMMGELEKMKFDSSASDGELWIKEQIREYHWVRWIPTVCVLVGVWFGSSWIQNWWILPVPVLISVLFLAITQIHPP